LEININSLIIQSIKNWPQKIKEIHHMIRLSVKLKKLFLISILLLLGAFTLSAQAQTPNIDFKYKIDSTINEHTIRYNVSVSILKGTAPFLVRLFEDFGKGHFEKIDLRENILTNEVQFIISKRGKYIIVVDDKNNNSLLKRVNLVNNQSL